MTQSAVFIDYVSLFALNVEFYWFSLGPRYLDVLILRITFPYILVIYNVLYIGAGFTTLLCNLSE